VRSRELLLRLVAVPPLVLLIITAVFGLVRLAPGDAAAMLVGPVGDPAIVARIRTQMGLDRPIHEQYLAFLGALAHGDLGKSLRTQQPVTEQLAVAIPATVELAAAAIAIAVVVGGTAGVLAAAKRGSLIDEAILFASSILVALPQFWVGLFAALVFALYLGWLPATGASEPRSIILPALTLSLGTTAFIARMVRADLVEVMGADYIRTARSKGLGERTIIRRHALRNALLPTLTVVGLQFGELLGGAVIVEQVFAWPGIGSLMYSAVTSRDYTMIQGSAIVVALGFVLVSLLVDVAYHIANPTIGK
jgi:ABC-type dipeptide/oligopeptide/nickel transport system permease component